MLSIVAFGITCELGDEGDGQVSIDHFTMTWQEAEVADLTAPEETPRAERPRRMFEQTHSLFRPDSLPRHIRWKQKRQRYRKKRTAVSIIEFADLSDGRRVNVRSDRGFSWSWKHSPGPFHNRTAESFTDELRRWFVQYEEDEPTPPEWIVKRFQRLYSIEVNPASVYDAMRAPLRVELGPRLLQLLPQQ